MEQSHEVVPVSVIESITRAEVDKQIATAHQYPRKDIRVVQDQIRTIALHDQESAEECFYSIPRGGKMVIGPSVVLAKIVAGAYGNIRTGSRIVDDGFGKSHITAQGIVHDLQANWAHTAEVKRKIVGKNGRFNEDMIGVTMNAAASIAFRDAVFKCVPQNVWKPIWQEAMAKAAGDEETLPTRRAKMLEWFLKRGFDEDAVCKMVDLQTVEDIKGEHVSSLLGTANAIRNGDLTIAGLREELGLDEKPASGAKKKTLDDVVPPAKARKAHPKSAESAVKRGKAEEESGESAPPPPSKPEKTPSKPAGDTETYKKCHHIWMGGMLPDAAKTSLGGKWGIGLITDVKKMSEQEQVDFLVALEEAKALEAAEVS